MTLSHGWPALAAAPLALLSFAFCKVTRLLVLRVVVPLHLALRRRRPARWRVLSAEEIGKPLALPVFMTTGPRWNVHSVVAFLGPLRVEGKVQIDTAAASRSARSWSIVVHGAPGHRQILTTLDSADERPVGWEEIQVRPGPCWLTARYYGWTGDAVLPAVRVDGVDVVPAREVPRDVNAFYEQLQERNNLFYLALQYYVGPMLRYRRWLPEPFVEHEYLPAGNPRTEFFYGAVDEGERLQLDLDPHLFRAHDLYLAFYSRASFPLSWYQIHEAHHTTPPTSSSGTFLLRVHHTRGEGFVRDQVRLRRLPQAEATLATPLPS